MLCSLVMLIMRLAADLALAVVAAARAEMLNQGGIDPQGLRYAAAGGQYQNFQALGVSVVLLFMKAHQRAFHYAAAALNDLVTDLILGSKVAVDACRANRQLLYTVDSIGTACHSAAGINDSTQVVHELCAQRTVSHAAIACRWLAAGVAGYGCRRQVSPTAASVEGRSARADHVCCRLG